MGGAAQRGKGGFIRYPLLAVVLSLLAWAGAWMSPSYAAARRRPNEIIIKLRPCAERADPGVRLEKLQERWAGRQIRPLVRASRREGQRADMDRVYRIRLDDREGATIEEILQAYRGQADVEYAEVNPIVSICTEPNDPRYDSQWALRKIDAAEAWDTCRGGREVVVAVIDTGVDYRHRDLAQNAWRNDAEFYGLDGVDDDENGYTDDVWGYNFIYNESDPMDDHGHGTHCAGTIAAVGDNGLDVSGVCWTARIMPVKILGADGDGSAADGAVAIYYAVDNGADVISCSWGGPERSELLGEAVAYAHRHGVVVIAAAGNENSDELFYPAARAEIIAVAATTSSDARSLSSNYGAWVDIAAPGRGILSLGLSSSTHTAIRSGTSMAAPHVAGAAALLLSADPFLTNEQVRELLCATGDPIAAGISASNARLNVANALRAAIPEQGIVRFDREVYAPGDDVGILLADWHLRGAGIQVVRAGGAGDLETVTLTETETSLGVFQAVVPSEDAMGVREDGRIQIRHGDDITVQYADADDGQGRVVEWTAAMAQVDGLAPTVAQVEVEMVGPVARVKVVASEPATAHIRYKPTNAEADSLTAGASEFSTFHRIKLGCL